jgi:hypothetical protein
MAVGVLMVPAGKLFPALQLALWRRVKIQNGRIFGCAPAAWGRSPGPNQSAGEL